VEQLKVAAMSDNHDNENIKASVSADLSLDSILAENPILVDNSHVRGMSDANSVFVELMRQLSPLISEEPEVILRFVARLDDIYMLNLCDDRSFITRVLPLVPGVILIFLVIAHGIAGIGSNVNSSYCMSFLLTLYMNA
jgi:hypothetical protein